MKLKRPLRGAETGADVRMVQRALNRWARRVPRVEIPETGTYDRTTSDRVMAFQAEQKIKPASGDFGQRTLDELWRYFDAYGRMRYRLFTPPKPSEERFEKLIASMKAMHRQTPGYLLGGGHGVPLKNVRYDQRLDCSSSCSKALWDAGMFDGEYAKVSGALEDWGVSGEGRYFTLYANAEHVWIRLHKTRWNRFDTSPHGDGAGSGPHLRLTRRSTSHFVVRHWPGL